MIPDWSFGINDDNMQKMVDKARAEGAKVVVVLSHNGMDVDLKMAARVTGVDVILGGHTHDAVPAPSIVSNNPARRWSATPARTASSCRCWISRSRAARSAITATSCCRCSPT